MRLNDDVKFGLLLVIVIASMLVQCYHPRHSIEVTYDCRLLNISPDLPPKVIEECRKKQYEWSQKHKEKS